MLDAKEKTPPPSFGRARSSRALPARKSWKSFVVPQGWEHFTAEDHAVWDLLFARQVELLGSRVVTPFLDGIDLLRLSHPGVPDVEGLNAILTPRTGWRTVAVPGLVPDDAFFAMLRERVFPVGNFIRRREQIDYLEEEGFVTRVADPDDRRKKTLVLTRSGLQVHAKARALVESIMSEALHGIPSHDMRTFTRILARMQEALNNR